MTKAWYDKPKMDALLGGKANVADAVSLAGSGNLPVAPGVAPFQGSASIAARSDHQHPIQKVPGYPVGARLDANSANPFVLPIGRPIAWTPVADIAAPLTPFPVRQPLVINQIRTWVGRSGDAGSCKVALYGSDVDGLPTSTPLWTSGAMAGTGAVGSELYWVGLSVAVTTPGIYWLAFGAYGFTTNRVLPVQTLNPDVAVQYMATNPNNPANAPTMNFPSTVFNGTTGVFSAAASPSYGNGSSAWAYAMVLSRP